MIVALVTYWAPIDGDTVGLVLENLTVVFYRA
jgi:hypothetical protein